MLPEPLEHWQQVWRKGIAPLLSKQSLEALQVALVIDDPRLLQDNTTDPVPLPVVSDWPVVAACPLGFCGWVGEGLETVGEVAQFFARITLEIDQRLGEPAGCRWFINWWDQMPREQVRPALLREVERALAIRQNTTKEELCHSS